MEMLCAGSAGQTQKQRKTGNSGLRCKENAGKILSIYDMEGAVHGCVCLVSVASGCVYCCSSLYVVYEVNSVVVWRVQGYAAKMGEDSSGCVWDNMGVCFGEENAKGAGGEAEVVFEGFVVAGETTGEEVA